MKKIRLNDRRVLWVIALVVLVLLMMDFNNRMSELTRLNQQYDKIQAKVTQQIETRTALENQIAYATSDVAVQEWAREEGHMAQPGDIPIVPIAPANSTPLPPSMTLPTPQPVANWQVWEALFFGK